MKSEGDNNINAFQWTESLAGWQSLGFTSAATASPPRAQRTSRAIEAGLGRAAGPVLSLVHLDTMARRISDCFMQAGVRKFEENMLMGETFQLITITRLLQRDLK